LAHPTRRDVIMALREGERSAGDILPPRLVAKPTLSDHLRILQHAGLVAYRRRGNRLMYRLNLDAVRPIENFLNRLRAAAAR
jgi:DNA-binding transcriptional ArsR family regulator